MIYTIEVATTSCVGFFFYFPVVVVVVVMHMIHSSPHGQSRIMAGTQRWFHPDKTGYVSEKALNNKKKEESYLARPEQLKEKDGHFIKLAHPLNSKEITTERWYCSAPYAYIGPYAYGTSHRVWDIPYAYGTILCPIRVWASHMSMHT